MAVEEQKKKKTEIPKGKKQRDFKNYIRYNRKERQRLLMFPDWENDDTVGKNEIIRQRS